MKPMKRIFSSLAAAFTAMAVAAAPSILDLKHTITDDHIIAPESFETKTRELEQSFFLKNNTVRSAESDVPHTGTPEEYEKLLSSLPVEIEMPYNSVVGQFIDMYLGRKRTLVADMLTLHNHYYGNMFKEELLKQGVPLELQYLPVIESAINPNAVSRAGACGLWQFMPSTATGLGMEVNSLVDERRDPRVSSRNAAIYLKQLYKIYDDWSLAIAAYNCGPGNVNKALRKAGGGKKDFWEIYNYLPKETRGYVPAFIAANFVMNYHDKYGITPTIVKHPLSTDTVTVCNRVHFNQISEMFNLPVDALRTLNPQFRKDVIPGDHHPYTLVLPSDIAGIYALYEPKILEYDRDSYTRRTYVEPGQARVDQGESNALAASEQTQNADSNAVITNGIAERVIEKVHIVGRGENLRDIAKKYGVSATDLKRWNNLRRGKVKDGDRLVVRIYQRELADASTAPTTESTVTKKVEPKKSNAAAGRSNNNKTKAKSSTVTYTVKSGDNLDKIARRYGTTVSAIQKANGMSKGSTRIGIGQKIKIPQGGTAKSGTKKKSGKRSRRRR